MKDSFFFFVHLIFFLLRLFLVTYFSLHSSRSFQLEDVSRHPWVTQYVIDEQNLLSLPIDHHHVSMSSSVVSHRVNVRTNKSEDFSMFVYCLEISFEETLHVLLVIDDVDD